MIRNATTPCGTIGRFSLLRELGHSARATVWLAHDPRLDREVALKCLHPAGDAQAVAACLNEARAVSRLQHPGIVPVFDVGSHDGRAFLVFEYVAGPTLAQALQQGLRTTPREAVTLIVGVLDALQAAHEQGVVHRDLKPSNILLATDHRGGGAGDTLRPRVTDFGLAARVVSDAQAAASPRPLRVLGTPGYLSPEAARGAAPLPTMDVFSVGLLLAELLCGRPMLDATDADGALHRVLHEDLLLPTQPALDEALRTIVQRALSRDAALRPNSAREFQSALQRWLDGPTAIASASDEPDVGAHQVVANPLAHQHATLDFLLRRMRHRTDFPALSGAVLRIQRVAASERESVRALSDAILCDVALTHKLLRLVNTAHYAAVSQGGVGTVTRAVALIGFAGIRNMALSLVLLEHMPDKSQAAWLKDEFIGAMLAGLLATELVPAGAAAEDAFLGALFQNLGRLLTGYYLPEEALQIRLLLGDETDVGGCRERGEAAARQVLGIGFDELGAGVARAWGLPDGLQRAARAPAGDWPTRASDRAALQGPERLRWVGRSANALVDVLLQHGAATPASALAAAAELLAPALSLAPDELLQAVLRAQTRLIEAAQALGLNLAPDSRAQRLMQAGSTERGGALANRPGTTLNPASAQQVLDDALELAATAIEAATMNTGELLHLTLDSLQRALGLRHVVLCLRETGGRRLVGRISLGAGAAELCSAFRFEPDAAAGNDLFAAVSARGADLLVADAATVSARLPPWYRRRIETATFLLLPLTLAGRSVGLIYADKARPGSLMLGEKELGSVRALRDLAVRAFVREAAREASRATP